MIIAAIDDYKIYAYRDGNMCVFNINCFRDTSSEDIGLAWKAGSRIDPGDAEIEHIKRDSDYHRLLMEALVSLSKVAIDFTKKLS